MATRGNTVTVFVLELQIFVFNYFLSAKMVEKSSVSYVNCIALIVSVKQTVEFWPPNTKLKTIQNKYPNCYVALVDGEFYGKQIPSWRVIVDPQRTLTNGTYFLGLGTFYIVLSLKKFR